MQSQNVDQHKKIIELWLEQNILEIIKESETLAEVTVDLSNGIGQGYASKCSIQKIK